MDINIQREFDNINSLLNVSSDEKNILEKQIQNYTNNQISKLNNNKEQQVYKQINTILKQICNQIALEYNIEDNIINTIFNNHKIKLKDDYYQESDSPQDNTSESDNDSLSDSEDTDKSISNTNTSSISNINIDHSQNITPICPEIKTDKPKSCPAKKGNNGQICGKNTIKSCNFQFCGYHKKYFKP